MPDPISARAKRVIEAGEKATPGPWRMQRRDGVRSGDSGDLGWDWETSVFEKDADAQLLMAARNDSPDIAAALVEVIPLARDLIDELEAAVLIPTEIQPLVDGVRAWLEKWEGR